MPFAPAHEGGAAARCAIGLLQGLQAHGVDYRVVAADARAQPMPAPEGLGVEMVRVEIPSRWRARWNWLVNPAGALADGPFAERVRALSREADIVHLVELHAAGAVGDLGRPTVQQLHCLTLRDREIRRPWRHEDRVSIGLLRAERAARRRADQVLVNSNEVADALERHVPRSRITVAPLALDPAHYTSQASLGQPVAGLIGTARWPPTANAVVRLLTRVWPLVRERRPTARLILAGSGMQASAFAGISQQDGVEWRGHVNSATDFLRELGLLLYPLSAGSGAKVKVLEALALGVPAVTTRDGAEGLLDRAGVLVEEDDLRIAEAAVSLMDDGEARRAAGARARANFLANHTPAVTAEPVVELYRRMMV